MTNKQWQDVIINRVNEKSTKVTYTGNANKLDNTEVTYNTLETDEECILNVTPPQTWDINLPDISPLEDHIIYNYKDIEDYFKDLLDDGLRIQKVENIDLQTSGYYCDMCNSTIAPVEFYHYKLDFDSFDLCEECYKNGDLEKTEADEIEDLKCSRYSCNSRSPVFYKLPKKVNGKEQIYFCEDCYGLRKKVKKVSPFDNGFGSFLDWLPIMRHKEDYHFLLYNCNPDSPNYHKPGIATSDDHGRMSYHVIEDKTLSEFMNELREGLDHYNKVKEENGNSWETFYSSPIPDAATRREWEVYIG